MKTKYLLLISALIFLTPITTFSQAPLSLDSLQVALWPEYDRTAMLVIYRIYLPSDTQLPAALSIRIPAAAGEPNAVAALTDAGLVNMKYEISQVGEWSVIDFSSDTLAAQIEYYDPGLVIQDNQRSYIYTWPGDYAVKNMQVEVQQPATASQLTSDPQLTQQPLGSDGLVYYNQSFGELAAGEEFTLSLGYSKADDKLTISSSPMPPEENSISPTITGFNWLWVIVPLAIGLLGYGLYGLVSTNRKSSGRKTRVRAGKKEKSAVYCHQCGKKALSGDKFCRNCGTKLRR